MRSTATIENIMDIALNKSQLRASILSQRSQLHPDWKLKYDTWICEHLLNFMLSSEVAVVHTYIPMSHEINIMPLIEKLLAQGFTVVCPKTAPHHTLTHWVLEDIAAVKKDEKGIPYPASNVEWHGDYDIIIVPGLAFDQLGYRLGYGGGYYDRFLKTASYEATIAPLYPFQLIEAVPHNANDMTVQNLLYQK